MPKLSDRLKSLGVQVGVENLPAPVARPTTSLEMVLSGKILPTAQGEAFIVEERFPTGSPHGHSKLELSASLEILSKYLALPTLAGLPAESFAFLDTETTGLSGGTGTFTFLIGAARFIGNEFVLEQFFLRDLSDEPAQLLAFEEFLAPSQVIVSFNGKSFDIPLLQTRFLVQGWQPPFRDFIHIDLLHLARKLWSDRLPSRTLGNLEVQILDADRTEEDVPGWMIPSLYHDYLHDWDANRLKPVFYHNKMDVISLAVLLDHVAGILGDPLTNAQAYGADLIALARLYEQIGEMESASQLYLHGLQHEDSIQQRLPRELLTDALFRLANIHKKQADFETALQLWQQAAALDHLPSHIELAKYYEHHLEDYVSAIQWTEAAIQLLNVPVTNEHQEIQISYYSHRRMLEEFLHRLDRLQRKYHLVG
jgi:uncharacterized protein